MTTHTVSVPAKKQDEVVPFPQPHSRFEHLCNKNAWFPFEHKHVKEHKREYAKLNSTLAERSGMMRLLLTACAVIAPISILATYVLCTLTFPLLQNTAGAIIFLVLAVFSVMLGIEVYDSIPPHTRRKSWECISYDLSNPLRTHFLMNTLQKLDAPNDVYEAVRLVGETLPHASVEIHYFDLDPYLAVEDPETNKLHFIKQWGDK